MKHRRGYYDVFIQSCAKNASNIAVRCFDNGEYQTYTYSELYGACEYISQILQQLKCCRNIIGLVSERNVIVPCIIAAAHKCCSTFMFLEPSLEVDSKIKGDVKFDLIIRNIGNNDEYRKPISNKGPTKVISIFNKQIEIFCLNTPQICYADKTFHEHYYIMRTSGSTGTPKNIKVPIKCLQPNIEDLSKLFKICQDDIIYFSTPLTFDPSMIEILLACTNGASLLIAPTDTAILFPEDKKNAITFWQTTPSKFFQYSDDDIKNKILSSNSSLKILALGGEPLNSIRRLKDLKHDCNMTKIFTLYGVTEMSCWACIAELDLNKIKSDKDIPLGKCLSETQLNLEICDDGSNMGSIVLVSQTRKCSIISKDKDNSFTTVNTGDLGEAKNGNIYYRGRRDDVIKRFGHKVNLQTIENIVMQCKGVKYCSCIWLPKPLFLVIYFTSDVLTSELLTAELKKKLDEKQWPDRIIRVGNLPTNAHGKVSKSTLAKTFDNSLENLNPNNSSFKFLLLNGLNELLGKNYSFDEVKDKSFLSLGGSSFAAVTLSNKLSKTVPKYERVLPLLLSQNHSINEIIQFSEKQLVGKEINIKRKKSSHSIKETNQPAKKITTESFSNTSPGFLVMGKYDTGKCVDASPTYLITDKNLYVAVGSHSGRIIVIDASNNTLIGTIMINSRVEAPVFCITLNDIGSVGVVGSYDGTITCFLLENAKVLWSCNITSMIKSKAAYCNGKWVIAAYNGKLYFLDEKTGNKIDTISVTGQAISADLTLAKKQYLIFGTLSGVCACLDTYTNNVVLWQDTLEGPIFGSPVLYDNDNYVVFGDVNGVLTCKKVEDGGQIWKFTGTRGNVFSSIHIKQINSSTWQMVYGCHDSKVYCVQVKDFIPDLQWSTELSSPVYSTPCAFKHKLILTANTKGKIHIINSETGAILHEYQLPGQTFSSPAVHEDNIFIGCRDDHFYHLKYIY